MTVKYIQVKQYPLHPSSLLLLNYILRYSEYEKKEVCDVIYLQFVIHCCCSGSLFLRCSFVQAKFYLGQIWCPVRAICKSLTARIFESKPIGGLTCALC